MITVLEFPLPSRDEFETVVRELTEQVDVEFDDSIPDACLGLSLEEGENAVSLQLIENQSLNRESLIQMKRSMVRKTGFMDIIEPEPLENLGGLENAKKYVFNRLKAWEKGNENLPKLRSILLIGIPGTGKTLFAKVLASIFNWPLAVADIGAMKGGIVGETEKKTRTFTKMADALGKAIILIDEIEKGFAGASGQLTDSSGVSQGQLGHFLSWSQERKSEAVLVATVNRIEGLPPEFLRAGRWDALFFVNFPNEEERKEIIDIMNRKWKSNIPNDEKTIERLEGWTGSEIEQLAKDSHFEDLDHCIESIPIIKKTKANEVKMISEYGQTIRRANGVSDKINFKKRKLDLRKVSVKPVLDEDFKAKITKTIKNEEEDY
jgi:SpoVK/Ycf46/Vps4 family AAA+-type ATPase